ncbi:unnamed protein product, partial [Mesorhabditis spiculigera]
MATLQLEQATTSQEDDIMQFLLSDFLHREPLNEALGLSAAGCAPFFRHLLRKGLRSGNSMVIRDDKGQIIATHVASFLYRPTGSNNNNNDGDNFQIEGDIQKIAGLLDRLDEQLFYIMIVSVSSNHQRQGIANRIMRNAEEQARSKGCQGLLAEATAHNSQKMFEKLGYEVIYELQHKDYLDEAGKQIIKCHDATDRAQLVFKRCS